MSSNFAQSALLVSTFFNWLLNETCNSFNKWPLNLSWISKKTIMEVGNFTEAAIFKSFLHLSYKKTQLLFFVTVLFNISWDKHWPMIFGVTQKYELHVSFKRNQTFYFSVSSLLWISHRGVATNSGLGGQVQIGNFLYRKYGHGTKESNLFSLC